jgi:hypothetical protein
MSYSLVHKGIKYSLKKIGNSSNYNVFIDETPISESSRIIYLDEQKQYKLMGVVIEPGGDFSSHLFFGVSSHHQGMGGTSFPLRSTVLNRLKSQVGQGRAGKKKIKKRFNKLNKEDILVEAEKQQINHLLSISTLVATIVGNDSWKDNNSKWNHFIEENISSVVQSGSGRKRKVKKSKKLRRKRISKRRNSRKRRYRRK